MAETNNIIPFPSALHRREVLRAAAAIAAGRSRGIEGWLDKQARWLSAAGVSNDYAREDLRQLERAIQHEISILLERSAHASSQA